MNSLDLHPWNSRASDMEHADELRFDLDPTDEFGFDTVIDVRLMKESRRAGEHTLDLGACQHVDIRQRVNSLDC
jgi:DNA primase